MLYVVTGAAGFIGSHLAEALLAGGHDLRAIDCLTPYYDQRLKEENAAAFELERLDYHPTARRFEHGTPPAPVYFIAQGGLDVIAEVTPERIRARQGELQDHLIARADELGLPVRTPRERSARGGVVNVGVGPEAGKICHALLDRDVSTDHRGDGLRISPHFFNTEADIDRCFEELRPLL